MLENRYPYFMVSRDINCIMSSSSLMPSYPGSTISRKTDAKFIDTVTFRCLNSWLVSKALRVSISGYPDISPRTFPTPIDFPPDE